MNNSLDAVLTHSMMQQVNLLVSAQTEKRVNPDKVIRLAEGLQAIVLVIAQMQDAGLSEISKGSLDVYVAQLNLILGEKLSQPE